jgi:Zn-finger nucleic acid-binding protein
MKCPVCKEPDLLMTERQGVEIDYCPSCRGVWLDRGELDKIIERLQAESGGGRAEQAPPRQDHSRADDRGHDKHHKEHDDGKHAKKKSKGSFIMDVFEGIGG